VEVDGFGEIVMARAIKLSDSLIESAKITGKTELRSTPKQIEYWARIGKIAEENPDLPLGFVKGILLGLEEIKAGEVSEYKFG